MTCLTARQAEVLQLAAEGLSGKQIGRFLGISPRTVEDHFHAMRQRTGTKSLRSVRDFARTEWPFGQSG